ncbi:hypothetical protein J5J01_14850 [Streptomyces fradiae]|uniref:hypothetical protein n=1 Tax=Streptomyces fradiae TaxID=1906 RepID=UPI002019C8F1|nr:hypothetical protein [Streptomyces fradiae]UQS28379.1 hypothetical protein J5J01_14850 [Streptomyces fradiae]
MVSLGAPAAPRTGGPTCPMGGRLPGRAGDPPTRPGSRPSLPHPIPALSRPWAHPYEPPDAVGLDDDDDDRDV